MVHRVVNSDYCQQVAISEKYFATLLDELDLIRPRMIVEVRTITGAWRLCRVVSVNLNYVHVETIDAPCDDDMIPITFPKEMIEMIRPYRPSVAIYEKIMSARDGSHDNEPSSER